ncbi:MAG: HAD-IA family hydrolase [Candidatus Dojkabacteria bacterium]
MDKDGKINTLLVDFARVVLIPKHSDIPSMSDLFDKIRKEGKDFGKHFRLNKALIKKLQALKSSHKIYLYSASRDIVFAKEIKKDIEATFDKIFTVKQLGTSKKSHTAYEEVLRKIRKRPSEVLFIDDKHQNIDAAMMAGLHVHQFASNKKLFSYLDQSLQ